MKNKQANFSKKAITIFLKYTFLECGEGPQQHPIERYLEV
jgi:hypothetical protein